MIVSEILIEKKSLNYIQHKLRLNLTFLVLFSLAIAVSVGVIIYAGINGVKEINFYLFAGFGILISAFYIYYVLKEYNSAKLIKAQILTNGNFLLKVSQQINPKRKYNNYTITYIVCAITLFLILVATIVLQIIDFKLLSLYTVSFCFAIWLMVTYQSINLALTDKIYRNSIFD